MQKIILNIQNEGCTILRRVLEIEPNALGTAIKVTWVGPKERKSKLLKAGHDLTINFPLVLNVEQEDVK